MYVGEFLVKEQHQERLRRAQEGRSANQAAELRRLERRSRRAERELLAAWQRVEQLRATLGPAS
jgi:hypothetical protein